MPPTSRRRFAKTITVAAAALPAATILAQTTPAPPATTTKAAEAQPPEPKKPSALAVALAGVVRAQSGAHLSADELRRIDNDFADYAPFIERFREHRLANSDEPDFTFHSLTRRW